MKKKKNIKTFLRFFFWQIAIIIINIIIVIIIIIIKKNIDFCEDFDILFICFVEFFAFISFLEKEDWKEISKSKFEENLKKKFVCAVCFFAEFALSKNIHFDCEFCDSILIFSWFSTFEFVAFFVVFSTLKNFANEN